MVEFIFGAVAGVVVTSVVFIIFGKNNKNTIDKARDAIVSKFD
jgi:cbb3-type cytochrome oxidase subunit 3